VERTVQFCSLRSTDQIAHDEDCGGNHHLPCVPIGQVSRAESSHSEIGEAE
jgi:hypothetical protein